MTLAMPSWFHFKICRNLYPHHGIQVLLNLCQRDIWQLAALADHGADHIQTRATDVVMDSIYASKAAKR